MQIPVIVSYVNQEPFQKKVILNAENVKKVLILIKVHTNVLNALQDNIFLMENA